MSQRILVALDNAQKKIVAAGKIHEDKLKITDRDKRAESVKKSVAAYKVAVFNYCNIAIHAIADGDIENDPFAIIYGRGLTGSLSKVSIKDALEQIRKESPDIFTKVDIVMAKAVSEGLLKKWKAKLSNGVNLVVNSKGVQFISGWIKEKIQWTVDMISNFIDWIKNQFANFGKDAEPDLAI